MSSAGCECQQPGSPCAQTSATPVVTNPPGLSTIAYRVDDFSGFREALLAPLQTEVALHGWHPAPGDLGLQLLEWWAYLADILTFYNERIANESYLGTAEQLASVIGIVALLGYQPRPAIAAVGQVAAIRSTARPNEALVIPAGMQLANSATPGVPVQTFETAAATFPGASDIPIQLEPSSALLQQPSNAGNETSLIGSVLLRGNVASLKAGDELLAVPSTFATTDYHWAKLSVISTALEADPNGGKNTRVMLDAAQLSEVQGWMQAAQLPGYRLLRSQQTAALWSQTTGAVCAVNSTTLTVWLSATVRSIAPGDLVFLDGGSTGTAVGQVTDASEAFTGVGYPGAKGSPPVPADIPVAHTVLTLSTPFADWAENNFTDPGSVAVRSGLSDVGALIGTPTATLPTLPVNVIPPAGFTLPAGGTSAFVEDATGAGVAVTATAKGDGVNLAPVPSTPAPVTLPTPLVAPLRLLVDVIDVSRGTTVAAETLGTGDATVAGQTFTLKQSPLTYLTSGATYVSTLQVAVDQAIWSEVTTFYGQPSSATVFVVSQLPDGTSQVRFGDGLNGARLPTGRQVVATYRYGAGAATPPAGRLTSILKPQPNLAAIHSPVPLGGGVDAQQADDMRQNAPKSVLTFGRAISGDDYETVAALTAGVARATAYWTWDPASQRTLVKVYVGDATGAATAATNALAGAEDPNRPVIAIQATAIELVVSCTLLVAPNQVLTDVQAAATASLADPDSGLFAPSRMAIGQWLYSSQIEAALLVDGAVAVHGLTVTAGATDVFSTTPIGWADPGEGCFYTLAATNPITIVTTVANG